MSEISVMDILLFILAVLFIGIGFAMRRLRNRMEVDMRKNIMPYMSMRHMFKHKASAQPAKKHKKK